MGGQRGFDSQNRDGHETEQCIGRTNSKNNDLLSSCFLLFLLLHHHQKVDSQRVKPSSKGQGELEKNTLKLLSQDVFIANPSGALHKSEVLQKHAP